MHIIKQLIFDFEISTFTNLYQLFHGFEWEIKNLSEFQIVIEHNF